MSRDVREIDKEAERKQVAATQAQVAATQALNSSNERWPTAAVAAAVETPAPACATPAAACETTAAMAAAVETTAAADGTPTAVVHVVKLRNSRPKAPPPEAAAYLDSLPAAIAAAGETPAPVKHHLRSVSAEHGSV